MLELDPERVVLAGDDRRRRRPSAISSAWFGPERTATSRSPTTWERRSPEPGSSPFTRLRIGAGPGASTTSRNARLRTATATSSASATGASSIVVARTPVRSSPRTYRGFLPVALMASPAPDRGRRGRSRDRARRGAPRTSTPTTRRRRPRPSPARSVSFRHEGVTHAAQCVTDTRDFRSYDRGKGGEGPEALGERGVTRARHERRAKSITTGTPARPNRSRRRFSTQ